MVKHEVIARSGGSAAARLTAELSREVSSCIILRAAKALQGMFAVIANTRANKFDRLLESAELWATV